MKHEKGTRWKLSRWNAQQLLVRPRLGTLLGAAHVRIFSYALSWRFSRLPLSSGWNTVRLRDSNLPPSSASTSATAPPHSAPPPSPPKPNTSRTILDPLWRDTPPIPSSRSATRIMDTPTLSLTTCAFLRQLMIVGTGKRQGGVCWLLMEGIGGRWIGTG